MNRNIKSVSADCSVEADGDEEGNVSTHQALSEVWIREKNVTFKKEVEDNGERIKREENKDEMTGISEVTHSCFSDEEINIEHEDIEEFVKTEAEDDDVVGVSEVTDSCDLLVSSNEDSCHDIDDEIDLFENKLTFASGGKSTKSYLFKEKSNTKTGDSTAVYEVRRSVGFTKRGQSEQEQEEEEEELHPPKKISVEVSSFLIHDEKKIFLLL